MCVVLQQMQLCMQAILLSSEVVLSQSQQQVWKDYKSTFQENVELTIVVRRARGCSKRRQNLTSDFHTIMGAGSTKHNSQNSRWRWNCCIDSRQMYENVLSSVVHLIQAVGSEMRNSRQFMY